MEKFVQYVKPEAVIEKEVAKSSGNPWRTLDEDVESEILAIQGAINEYTVRKACHVSRANARQLLLSMHSQAKLKTKAERIKELNPPKVEPEITKEL